MAIQHVGLEVGMRKWRTARSTYEDEMRDRAFQERQRNPIDRPIMKDNRHKFERSLRFGLDEEIAPYVRATTKLLEIYNLSTLQRFADSLQVSPLKDEPQFIDGKKVHYFVFGRSNFLVKVPVFLESKLDLTSRLQKHDITVVDGDSTYSLEDWVRSLPPLAPTPMGEAGYRMLHAWHRECRAHRSSPVKSFSNMPVEIQDDIITHMVGAVRPLTEPRFCKAFNEETVTPNQFNLVNGDDSAFRPYGGYEPIREYTRDERIVVSSLRPRIPALNIDSLLLNKEIYKSVKLILRTRSIMSFCTSDYIASTISHAPQSLWANMTRVQLAFSDFEYFGFFDLELPGIDKAELAKKTIPRKAYSQTPSTINASVLRQLPALKYLELWFNSPLNPYACSPWYATNTADAKEKDPEINRRRFPCRKTMVDYILTAAFPHVQHIQHLNITGYVKTSTREHWLSIFRNHNDRPNQLAKVEQKLREMKTLGPAQM